MANSRPTSIAVVTGNVMMDWNLAHARGPKAGASGFGDYVRACWQRGGAALLADVIEAVADSLRRSGQADFVVCQTDAPREPPHPGDERVRHSYAMWSQFRFSEQSPRDTPTWRVEAFLGHDPGPTAEPANSEEWKRVVDDTPEAELLVLDDAGLGFRDRPDLWPQAIRARETRPWILVKMSAPIAHGLLWEQLHHNHADRLIVVMTANDLRRTEVQISRELSWERTAQDLFWELVHNPCINALSHCAHAVISFGPAGVVLLSRVQSEDEIAEQTAWQCYLFFDPKVIEGMWELNYPGGMIGYNTCLTTAIASQLMLSPDQPDIHQGVQSGLAAMRRLHLEGYGERGMSAEQSPLVFPTNRIVAEITKPGGKFAVVEVQDPVRFLDQPEDDDQKPLEGGFWTILEDQYRDNLEQVAEQIVLEGADATLKGVPLGLFGSLLTVDRHEIESFRSIRALVREYCRQGRQKRPLSIAVFGAPGSGKSFGITQVARSLLPGQIEVLEFNLSQFGSTDDLLAALHQVRDVGLSGEIPLVFWDEFDTALDGKSLGWLRYFLAPMQDGRFQEGQISHPIGRSIFVFAGGTCERVEDFGQAISDDEFRAAKGPDFVSRLKGYVNIQGPNRQGATPATVPDPDPYHIIRRAILLRSILKRNAPQLFEKQDDKEMLNVDRGVLRAFLGAREYRHGVRSMEAIVAMSLLTGKTAYERSSLPAEAQLDLHVDGQDFLALVQFMDLQDELLERLAEAAHDVFCESMKAKGYRLGENTDDELKTHSSLKPYDELSEHEKEQNRGNVRDIPAKLARAGYVMVPARSDEPPFNFPGDALELLAEMEHERWMEAKHAAGWQHAPETDKEDKLHSALVPWDELPAEEKEKDREFVRAIPKILARAGYAIVKTRGEARR